MLELFKLNHTLDFPSVEFALDEPNGLLAFGGDLSVQRLITAYKQGIFPWYSEQEPILWWSPSPRAIIYADTFKANKSLRKSIKKYQYTASLNTRFDEVIRLCANVNRDKPALHQNQIIDASNAIDDEKAILVDNTNTWITNEMLQAYKELHKLGYAHSVEIFNSNQQLVGGLYGVVVSGIFCGESMFHLQTDASKAALFALSEHMRTNGMNIIDCQLVNDHLTSLGCKAIKRDAFLTLLRKNTQIVDCWQPQSLALTL